MQPSRRQQRRLCEIVHNLGYGEFVSDDPDFIPEVTVTRLPVYRRCLVELTEQSITTVSSERLATMAGVNAAKVRKDLSYLGSYGTRGVGYDVEFLLFEVSRELGMTTDRPVVIVGAGNLGSALVGYSGFNERGFPVRAIFDNDPNRVGSGVGEFEVLDLARLSEVVERDEVAIGVIATPPASAQAVADAFVEAGIRSILNFAPCILDLDRSIAVRRVDLASELQVLSFYQHQTDPLASR
jgi:redox-sensing transcriptional repressor